MLRYLLFFLSFLFSAGAMAEGTPLTPMCQVSILTCDPGTEPYAIFGHSALRIRDPSTGLDVVFNYGTFDFDDPHFYTKFLSGRLTYYLSSGPYEDFIEEYEDDHKRVREQALHMDLSQKQLLWDKLAENEKPANRNYKYDFFYDNCSTRIRDAINGVAGDVLWADVPAAAAGGSFRQEIRGYFVYNPWTGFGIDICLGLAADKRPSVAERMFLPFNLFDAMDHASIGGRRLVDSTVVHDFHHAGIPAPTWYSPAMVCWALFVLSLLVTWAEMRYRRRVVVFDVEVFALTGLIGLALLALWFFTDYSVTKFNLNLLWACPLNLFILLPPRFSRHYFSFYAVVLGMLLVFFVIVSRYFDPAVLPLILTLFIRCVARSARFRSFYLRPEEPSPGSMKQ